jgi:hypothetical protein
MYRYVPMYRLCGGDCGGTGTMYVPSADVLVRACAPVGWGNLCTSTTMYVHTVPVFLRVPACRRSDLA